MEIPHLLSKVTDSIMLILSLKCSIKVVFLIQLSILLYSYYTDLVFLYSCVIQVECYRNMGHSV